MKKMKNFISAVILLFCCVTITDAQTIPSYVPTTGLVGWWPFNGNATDESVNTNDGTVNGATLTTDRFGVANSAYYFSSASCLTRIDAAINTSSIVSGLTISVWILRSGNGCSSPRVLEFYSSGGSAPGQMDIGWDNFGFGNMGSITSTGYIVATGWTKPSNNVWTHLVYTNNGLFGKFYQDGVLINNIPSIGGPVLSGNAAFGRMNHPSYDAFNGKLDDIGIWNRALNTCEVKQLYMSSLNTFTMNAISSSSIICSGQTTTLSASGAISYTWQPMGIVSNTNVISPLTSSLFTVVATSTAGCIDSKTISVSVNPTPTITVNSGVICSGSSFSMVPSGASTYTYSSGTSIVNPLMNSSYTVTGTNALGCISANLSISNVTVNPTPTITVNSGAICSGSSFSMVPSGASTYTYSSGTSIVNPLMNSSYTVTGTNALGCISANLSISNVTVNPTPTITVNSGMICTGESFSITPAGASTYTYSSGSSVVSPTLTTTYSVTGTSLLGCVSQSPTTLTVFVSPCTGIDELDNNKSIIFYPNPFKNEIYVKTEADILNKKYLIYNASGQLIQSGILNGNKINCSDFSKGLYFIKLEGSAKAFRLVKEN